MGTTGKRNEKKELSKLGYIEVLYEVYGENAFTFLTHNKKSYQLDYLFIPKNIRISGVNVPDKSQI